MAPSGMRCRTSQLLVFAGSARRLSPFYAGSPVCVCEQNLLTYYLLTCEQHLLRLASYASRHRLVVVWARVRAAFGDG